MLTGAFAEQLRVFAICANSGEVKRGDRFDSVTFADGSERISNTVVCAGVKDDELILRSEDMRVWFSLRLGWGASGGALYGIEKGFYCDFGRPADADGLKLLAAEAPAPHGWAQALEYQARRKAAKKIVAVLFSGQQ